MGWNISISQDVLEMMKASIIIREMFIKIDWLLVN